MLSRLVFTILMISLNLYSATLSPWGSAKLMDTQYKPQKVIYDVDYGSLEKLTNILDRISYLKKLYKSDPFESSIIVVLHGDSIPYFAKENTEKNLRFLKRAYDLTLDGVIEFRMCKAAALLRHYTHKDIHGFIQMVPMADAEIIRLQKEESYSYMR